ncbi:MAG: hypothetical protein GY714_20080 [Desulfobacterales bacterium]|nr:hypothetical protein [Desulfobacterales bacterium]
MSYEACEIYEEATCPDCNGSGKGQNEFINCRWCAGTGTIYIIETEEE